MHSIRTDSCRGHRGRRTHWGPIRRLIHHLRPHWQCLPRILRCRKDHQGGILGNYKTSSSILSFSYCGKALFITLTFSQRTHALSQADKEKLANVLKYHVVEGVTTGKELLTCGELKTLQGSMVKSVVDASERAFMNDEAKVETTDVEADNGVFHIIDYPLNPPKSA